jgi:hypothetical protein
MLRRLSIFVSMDTLNDEKPVEKDFLPPFTVESVVESVEWMFETVLSRSLSDASRPCASSALRGTAVPTSAGAMLIVVAFICVAMFVREFIIKGVAKAVAFDADIDAVLH